MRICNDKDRNPYHHCPNHHIHHQHNNNMHIDKIKLAEGEEKVQNTEKWAPASIYQFRHKHTWISMQKSTNEKKQREEGCISIETRHKHTHVEKEKDNE